VHHRKTFAQCTYNDCALRKDDHVEYRCITDDFRVSMHTLNSMLRQDMCKSKRPRRTIKECREVHKLQPFTGLLEDLCLSGLFRLHRWGTNTEHLVELFHHLLVHHSLEDDSLQDRQRTVPSHVIPDFGNSRWFHIQALKRWKHKAHQPLTWRMPNPQKL
jgi:hypothetical protein